MKPISIYVVFLLVLISVSGHAVDDFPGVENLMTAAQFREAGLDKLSTGELGELNRWLTSYTANEAPIVKQTSKSVKKAKTALITSQIDGKFTGWTGKTMFRLKNGQVWRQRYSGRYWYSAVDPKVEIKKNMLGFYQMKVLATGKTIGVRRVE
ncbi:MAG: hypothetical protein ACR2PS_17985 [Pseudomonadales bacterium]